MSCNNRIDFSIPVIPIDLLDTEPTCIVNTLPTSQTMNNTSRRRHNIQARRWRMLCAVLRSGLNAHAHVSSNTQYQATCAVSGFWRVGSGATE